MQEKILYYFGAGGSAFALPLARSITDSQNMTLQGLAAAMRSINYMQIKKKLKEEEHADDFRRLNERFQKLADKADEFGDVDTYAKYLHLMRPGSDELSELKQTLSEFFILKQLLLGAQDYRYLPWLVSIMNQKKFPDNIKVLNWNYDFQIQLAFEQISELEKIEYDRNSFIHTPSVLSYYPNLDPTFSEHHLLSVIHLNGIAGYMEIDNLTRDSVFQKKVMTDVGLVLKYGERNKGKSLIHFAWEKSEYITQLEKHIKSMIDRTTILVVVGYSFPFFNREIDKMIFSKLKEGGLFRKIYFQDPVLTGQQLKAQFNLDSHVDIVHVKNISSFHIPFEY